MRRAPGLRRWERVDLGVGGGHRVPRQQDGQQCLDLVVAQCVQGLGIGVQFGFQGRRLRLR